MVPVSQGFRMKNSRHCASRLAPLFGSFYTSYGATPLPRATFWCFLYIIRRDTLATRHFCLISKPRAAQSGEMLQYHAAKSNIKWKTRYFFKNIVCDSHNSSRTAPYQSCFESKSGALNRASAVATLKANKKWRAED